MAERLQVLQVYFRAARKHGAAKVIRSLADSHSLAAHWRRIIHSGSEPASNSYVPSFSREEERRFCVGLAGASPEAVAAAFAEIDNDSAFGRELAGRYRAFRPDSPVALNLGRFAVWYVLARLLRPRVVLETGVHDGLSSAVILRAMERNGAGGLISIDLPSVDLPPGAGRPGWLVPEHLRWRWALHLGNARKLLPRLAAANAPLDFFIHDSDHSRAFQQFEYETAIVHLARPGLLLSDDARPDLMREIASEQGLDASFAFGAEPSLQIILGGIRITRD